jgi:hypothetical protein
MTGRLGTAVLVVAVVCGAAVTAGAQPSAEVQAKATELVNEGIKLQSKRDYDGAVAKYKAAYCLIPEPALVYNIGTAFQEASRNSEAASYFRMYLKVAASGDLAPDAKAALKALKDKSSSVGIIQCEVEKPRPPEPVCADGAAPVDGVCPAPVPACEPPMELLGNKCVAVLDTRTGTEGSGKSGRNKTLLYAGFGAAGAGAISLGLGIMFGLKAQDASDKLTAHTSGPWTQELLDLQKEGKDAERNQIIFTTVGGVLVAGGAVMVVFGMRKHEAKESTSARFVPYVDGDEAGVVWTTSY